MNSSPSSFSIFDKLLERIERVPASDRWILRVLFFLIIASVIFLIITLNNVFSDSQATRGGMVREGILGTPRFVNPALAVTRADRDVVALVYSGLLRIDERGNLVPDIAESITVSDDGLTYNIVIRQDISFHDGTPLTASDVAYTFRILQDPDLASPLRGNWVDVLIQEVGPYELNVVLAEPYTPFLENFTVGILPQHLWGTLTVDQQRLSQLNTEPIGSGPFRITSIRRDPSLLVENYTLSAFDGYPTNPKLAAFSLQFFQTETELIDAFTDNTIDATAYISNENLSSVVTDAYTVHNRPLPRVFGIFFNQNKSIALRDEAARKALSVAIDRDELIATALTGGGVPTNAPITIGASGVESVQDTDSIASSTAEVVADILETGGWYQTDSGYWEKELEGTTVALVVTLRTANSPLFEAITEAVRAQWEAVGVSVTTEQFEQTGLVQSVIRPRDFEALLFGFDMGRSNDLYPFWHSSQQDDPGLNISQYANLTVDDLLETARTEQDQAERLAALAEANQIIIDEVPAIFLFQPAVSYVVDKNIEIIFTERPARPSDRFSEVAAWYTNTDTLWPIFYNSQ